jgi:hypothetical protein
MWFVTGAMARLRKKLFLLELLRRPRDWARHRHFATCRANRRPRASAGGGD